MKANGIVAAIAALLSVTAVGFLSRELTFYSKQSLAL